MGKRKALDNDGNAMICIIIFCWLSKLLNIVGSSDLNRCVIEL
jgi:hypothetical protein